ncbi:MAG: prolipoprotein diacylglyceryl transferase [Candidatus Marinimicrobia bacterium]|jgi:phosphatidylglycerol:prolipoprotein diacylglycerol transferase|nr:prolipoprotein diacylglyceryl transferase [Candidatus Neomarinimicrobiota bacterium]
MYPVLFEIGPFVISSFGVMMVVAFLLGNYLLKKDVVADGFDPIIAEDITFRAAIGGILGAKIYYLIETIPTGEAANNITGLVNIIAGIFTFSASRIADGIQNFGAGLVFLGGLMGGMLAVSLYLHKKKLKWLQVADWVAPFLALGHGIGRIGCFLVGDDYGIPTNVPWACTFPNGLPPTTIPVHPTQLYEMTAYLSIFFFLRYRKKHQDFSGELMFEYLFLAGFARFMVEFIRTNTKYIFDLSGAQLISIIMMAVGTWFMWKFRREAKYSSVKES